MNAFVNIDLLSVGIAIAASLILGFIVFIRETKSAANILLFTQVIFLSAWSIVNYFSYQIKEPSLALLLVRFVMFFGIAIVVNFFFLMHTFPSTILHIKKTYTFILSSLAIGLMGVTLSPFLFTSIEVVSNGAPKPVPGPGMFLFIPFVLFMVGSGIFFLIKRFLNASGEEKVQLKYLLIGVALMFSLILLLDLALPVFFGNTTFIPLSAVFMLPFVVFTAYAILKYHLLGVKIIATEILTFILAIVTFAEVIFTQELALLVFRSGVFLLVLSFGIMLIRSVRKEVEQKEHLQKLSEELARANDRLKLLDKQKSEFLSFASHDLKSPIALIKQFASLIFDGTYKEPEKIHETVGKIKMTADRAVNMVNTFLDLRKIEEGHMEYNFEKKNLVDFIGGITSDFVPLAKQQKNIEVSFETAKKEINAVIDTTTFRQVIQNFLDNSLKYTEKGWIKVKIEEEQKSVLITISDSGLGMDKDLLPILFEQFRRDPTAAKKIQGTGLGLFISKQIVQAHHGDTWAESEGKGHGSTFFIRIPKA